VAAEEITHVIAVSCTGFFAPGLDVQIVKRLGLPSTTQRTLIGFMGCYAAFNALRVAHSFCQSHPNARVLLVCVELCTLHFQIEDTLESVVVNALFADGAAAAVLSARPEADARGRLAYLGSRTVMDDDSEAAMTWTIGDTGFQMGLSSRVPDVIAQHLPGYTQALLADHGRSRSDVDAWAIHPGGRRIVERAQDVLGLSAGDVATSLSVLRDYGNMSSPTILFVLQRLLGWDASAAAQSAPGGDGETPAANDSQVNAPEANATLPDPLTETPSGTPPSTLVAMAFGPGLTIEGALFGRVGA
jgi:predicted naringenin-chalcone synthase